ncbi:unnamed protein product [Cuscuta epithymum]|uniref:Uncharacterized protein n=1 Tax=Cuscuta epithymum TaxID=186058 RepID=A0AAV0E296_9ASTE|nr:unnamed protein product [Cuscuta epithymum]
MTRDGRWRTNEAHEKYTSTEARARRTQEANNIDDRRIPKKASSSDVSDEQARRSVRKQEECYRKEGDKNASCYKKQGKRSSASHERETRT